MRSIDSHQRVATRDPAIAGLADARRRRILAVLCQESTPVGEDDLARWLAEPSGAPSAPVPGAPGFDAVRSALRHVHLPVLSTAGLVAWDPRAATVTRSTHPLYESEDATAVLQAGEEYDEVFDCLANARRRAVLAALDEHGGALDGHFSPARSSRASSKTTSRSVRSSGFTPHCATFTSRSSPRPG